jgi:hypothetical protein
MADAMPDNDASDFLSHYMEPIEQVLCVGVQIELELAHGVPTIGEKGDLLVELMALRLEHFEQATFWFLVVGLDKGKAFTGDSLFGLLAPCKGQQTLARDHLEPPLPRTMRKATTNSPGRFTR